MTPDAAAEVTRAVEGILKASNEQLLDAIIARALTPVELRWHDVRTEAPPEGERVLVAQYGEVQFATYLGENGQTYRRLPNPECWGHWGVGNYEGPYQIHWWMPVPLSPMGDE